MNKNLLAVAVATAMTMPMVALAAGGNFTIKGDARYLLESANVDKTVLQSGTTESDTHDWRARVTTTYTNQDNVKVVLRLNADDDQLSADTETDAKAFNNGVIDQAYLEAPVMGMKIKAGRFHSTWGTKFLKDNTPFNGINISKSFGAMTIFTGYDKENENTQSTTKGNTDRIVYSVGVAGKSGVIDWGLLGASYTEEKVATVVKAKSMTAMDIYVKAKFGNISVNGEFAQVDKGTGMQFTAIMPIGKMSVSGHYITTTEFSPNTNYTPFGGLDDTFELYKSATKDNTNSVFGANLNIPVAGMNATAGFALATIGKAGTKEKPTGDASVTIAHVKITKALGKQTDVFGKLASASGDRSGSSMSAGLKVKF